MKNDNILVCKCSSNEHHIIFSKIEGHDDIYCNMYLNDYKSFMKRFVTGIKYIFGYKCKYGHWDEFILSEKHSDDLKEMSEFLKNKNKT